jgi:hypothetical protein
MSVSSCTPKFTSTSRPSISSGTPYRAWKTMNSSGARLFTMAWVT